MKTDQMYGIDVSSKTRVRCIFCGVFIPKASKCIEQHLGGLKHRENISMMRLNGIIFINDILHCKPCKRNLSNEETVFKHVDSEDHSNWMAAVEDLVDGEFITLEAYFSGEKDDAYCEVCDTDINCSLQNIEEHVNHINHRTNIAERLKPLNGIFAMENGEEVWCKVCDVKIDNNVCSILSHIDDNDRHMDWFSHIEDLIEDQEVTIESFLVNEHEKNAYCKKCHMEILCRPQNIEHHVFSEAHLNRFAL